MLLQATLNGPLTRDDHPAVPLAPEELRDDAAACERAGAQAFHVHPRDATGRECTTPAVVDAVVATVRDGTRWPVGVTTGAWIEPERRRLLQHVHAWRQPDYASVNLSEEGALEVAHALLSNAIGVEAGVWTVEDAELLVRSELGDRVLRVLVEPVDVPAADAVAVVDAIHAVLDRGGVTAPRLQHGDGEATWPLVEDAVRRGVDTRIGFEDTLLLPDGTRAASNAELVAAARALGAGEPRR
ncbi:3-keto-5-aminohexanoate cleavage protein [Amnibacterium sp. CER49]|uniref:3-keto-5-aminohexanoate cleavage protein n=1 Tax=Amnibacterium sp. CER49 TaxID=3039161 RepID=UPI00244A2C2D|nr:3-keto-5-aminohexanoate cleavage protein [Amnibacterium sp. CER49]MDH2445396.1 3-keto-5-aminohexanoate cleavage protein [Amnibacterium sp. CER49]